MPAFSYRDKLTIMQEQTLWTVTELLKQEASAIDHAWQSRIAALAQSALELAQELRSYNEQFETEDD